MSTAGKTYILEDKTFRYLDRTLWKRLFQLTKGHRWLLLLSFFTLLGAELLPQFEPKILRDIVDGPVATGNTADLLHKCLLFFGVVISSFILRYITSVLSQVLALRIIHELRQQLFKHVSGLHSDFFKRTPVGRLMTRLTNDIDAINGMFAEGFVDLAGAFLMLIFPVYFMFLLNPTLAWVSLALTPVLIISTSIFRVQVRNVNVDIRKYIAELNTRMQEILSGNHIVQIFGKSLRLWEVFNQTNQELKKKWLKNVYYYALYFPVISGTTEISLALVYFTGGYLFFRDQVSVGTLIAFSWYLSMFWRPLREISDKYTQLQSALAAAERVFTLFEINNPLPHGNKKITGPLKLEFKKVTFGYEPSQDVLKNIDLTIREGETVAVVGATGSGKSTLLSLCNYAYPAGSGSITLNGIPFSELDPQELSKLVSFIPQDVYLFSESIAFNISLSEEVDQARLEKVCKMVNAHPFIEKLPEKYQTKLKARGENLSTGQRQLLAFARALYHQPKLLLLDEATSSIDTLSEQLIQDALEKMTKQVTSIIVAHRLSTIRNADRIIVIHKGEIREKGNHDELYGLGGIYTKLCDMQAFDSSRIRG